MTYDDWKLASPPDSPCDGCDENESCIYDHYLSECLADKEAEAADRAYDIARESF